MRDAGLRPGFVNQQPWELSCLLWTVAPEQAEVMWGLCHGVPPDTGDTFRRLFSPGTVEGAWEEEVSRALGQC